MSDLSDSLELQIKSYIRVNVKFNETLSECSVFHLLLFLVMLVLGTVVLRVDAIIYNLFPRSKYGYSYE